MGAPAYAGMDPSRHAPRRRRDGCPRIRGDGPVLHAPRGVVAAVPPHTRGWTHGWAPRVLGGWGAPAYAGMDPECPRGSRRPTRCPRIRGDGPCARVPPSQSRWVPPHTRGWTLVKPVRQAGRVGAPAYAGMDPSRRTRSWCGRRCPRIRGDGPATLTGLSDAERVPPHTRGWTRADARRRGHDRGAPAYAGMDR